MARQATSFVTRAVRAVLSATTVLAFATVPAALLSGCGSQEGETVMTGGPETTNNVGKATQDGTYKLYTAMSPNPTLTAKLKEGDKLGFRKTDDGRIEAVYGEETHVFNKGTAQVYWKLEK
jgi:hypothetical protein